MERVTHNRFKTAPWYQEKDSSEIIVGGAGGIGSWTAMLLSRAGFKPIVFDFDVLEVHNLGGQLYPKHMIGQPKVEALRKIIGDFCDDVIDVFNDKITLTSPTNVYVISAFDNMRARKDMFYQWLSIYGKDPTAIFIDGRLDAEKLTIFCVKGGDSAAQQKYDTEHLFDDTEVPDAPCTLKQTSHAAAMIASHIVGFFTNHITNVMEEDDSRTVPFMWDYFIPMDLLDVQNQ